MKSKIVKAVALAAAVMSACTLGGCGSDPTYENFTAPSQGESTLKPVESYYIEQNYDGVQPTKEKTQKTYSSENGLCVIQKKESYYDVTLDYEKGSYHDVGAAYAEMIIKAYPQYTEVVKSYIFENIRGTFGGIQDDFSALEARINTLKSSIDKDYQQEMEGFAETISGGTKGIKEDGKLSYEEALLLSMVPDALRPTSCSAISADGSKTQSGKRITARLMDWSLGSDNQLSTAHCVTHFKNSNKSFTSIGLMGMLDVVTAVNPKGLLIGEFDVGSYYGSEYTCEGKTCYSYDLRHTIENYSTAKGAAQYLINNCSKYTFNVNALLSDENDAFCAELCIDPTEGTPVIRDGSTELMDGLEWDSKDYLCIVNSYATKGNKDQITYLPENLIRWKKYNEVFCGESNVSLDRFKELLTCEKNKDSNVVNFRGDNMVHMVLVDYNTKSIQAIFTGKDGVTDEPVFIDLGNF